jgi:hypothetical protein
MVYFPATANRLLKGFLEFGSIRLQGTEPNMSGLPHDYFRPRESSQTSARMELQGTNKRRFDLLSLC